MKNSTGITLRGIMVHCIMRGTELPQCCSVTLHLMSAIALICNAHSYSNERSDHGFLCKPNDLGCIVENLFPHGRAPLTRSCVEPKSVFEVGLQSSHRSICQTETRLFQLSRRGVSTACLKSKAVL